MHDLRNGNTREQSPDTAAEAQRFVPLQDQSNHQWTKRTALPGLVCPAETVLSRAAANAPPRASSRQPRAWRFSPQRKTGPPPSRRPAEPVARPVEAGASRPRERARRTDRSVPAPRPAVQLQVRWSRQQSCEVERGGFEAGSPVAGP